MRFFTILMVAYGAAGFWFEDGKSSFHYRVTQPFGMALLCAIASLLQKIIPKYSQYQPFTLCIGAIIFIAERNLWEFSERFLDAEP